MQFRESIFVSASRFAPCWGFEKPWIRKHTNGHGQCEASCGWRQQSCRRHLIAEFCEQGLISYERGPALRIDLAKIRRS